MNNEIIERSREFSIEFLRGKDISYENLHPWRKGWQFVILHSFRVEEYALKIIEKEKIKLPSEELLLVKLASILHDIGRTGERDGHAKNSMRIVENWLQENPSISEQIGDTQRLLYLIAIHSDKGIEEKDRLANILKDADVLDEVGAMSIFMASNRINRESPFFFNELSERVNNYELEFCDKQYKKLQTESAKKMLLQKKEFICSFTEQLNNELQMDDDAAQFIKMNLNN